MKCLSLIVKVVRLWLSCSVIATDMEIIFQRLINKTNCIIEVQFKVKLRLKGIYLMMEQD